MLSSKPDTTRSNSPPLLSVLTPREDKTLFDIERLETINAYRDTSNDTKGDKFASIVQTHIVGLLEDTAIYVSDNRPEGAYFLLYRAIYTKSYYSHMPIDIAPYLLFIKTQLEKSSPTENKRYIAYIRSLIKNYSNIKYTELKMNQEPDLTDAVITEYIDKKQKLIDLGRADLLNHLSEDMVNKFHNEDTKNLGTRAFLYYEQGKFAMQFQFGLVSYACFDNAIRLYLEKQATEPLSSLEQNNLIRAFYAKACIASLSIRNKNSNFNDIYKSTNDLDNFNNKINDLIEWLKQVHKYLNNGFKQVVLNDHDFVEQISAAYEDVMQAYAANRNYNCALDMILEYEKFAIANQSDYIFLTIERFQQDNKKRIQRSNDKSFRHFVNAHERICTYRENLLAKQHGESKKTGQTMGNTLGSQSESKTEEAMLTPEQKKQRQERQLVMKEKNEALKSLPPIEEKTKQSLATLSQIIALTPKADGKKKLVPLQNITTSLHSEYIKLNKTAATSMEMNDILFVKKSLPALEEKVNANLNTINQKLEEILAKNLEKEKAAEKARIKAGAIREQLKNEKEEKRQARIEKQKLEDLRAERERQLAEEKEQERIKLETEKRLAEEREQERIKLETEKRLAEEKREQERIKQEAEKRLAEEKREQERIKQEAEECLAEEKREQERIKQEIENRLAEEKRERAVQTVIKSFSTNFLSSQTHKGMLISIFESPSSGKYKIPTATSPSHITPENTVDRDINVTITHNDDNVITDEMISPFKLKLK